MMCWLRWLSCCVVLLLLGGCDNANTRSPMNAFDQLKEDKLQFTCTQEQLHVPPITPESDVPFQAARRLEKTWPRDYQKIGELYRLAAEQNHWKAMNNLQNLIARGKVRPLGKLEAQEEVINWVEKMMSQQIPAGYYAMGYYLETGYGVKADKMASLAYYRKAADLGNPQGQYVIGNLLGSKVLPDRQMNPVYRPEIGIAMMQCSAKQGYAEAAYSLAIDYKLRKDYPQAVEYYHLAAKNGGQFAASELSDAFVGRSKLSLAKDEERARRYALIASEVNRYDYARFPDIDKIVPLPPAELPEWDGTFEYRKALDTGMPSE